MKNRNSLLIAATVVALTVTSCKTTEKNYRNAYETALQHQIERQGGDVSDGATLVAKGALNPRPFTVNDITLPVATTWVSAESGVTSPIDSIRRYNVAVGQFKQIFNANAMFSRMKASGYPNSIMMKTSEGYYLIATYATDNSNEALTELNKVEADTALNLKAPFPFILRPAQFAR